MFAFCTFTYNNILKFLTRRKNIDHEEIDFNGFLNSFVSNMQIALSYFQKMIKHVAIAQIHLKKLKKYMNLTPKMEKQEINYLNYSNTLWDYVEFYIA